MKKIIFVGLLVMALATTVMAQQGSEKATGSMQGMMQGMTGEHKSGESGMQDMGGMMGMMKMMDQCNAMMAAHKTTEADSALDILKKRYAKGEISKDEFERIKKDVQ